MGKVLIATFDDEDEMALDELLLFLKSKKYIRFINTFSNDNYLKYDNLVIDSKYCIFRKNCASVPEERSAIPLQTEQSSAG